MDGSGQGSPPTEFILKGFEEDAKGVKEPITRGGYETGSHDDPAVEKIWFLCRNHGPFDPVEKAIRRPAGNQENSGSQVVNDILSKRSVLLMEKRKDPAVRNRARSGKYAACN